MPRLSTLQDQTRRRLLDLATSNAKPEAFEARLLTILQAAIPPAARACWQLSHAQKGLG